MTTPAAAYEGEWNAGAKEFRGNWKQGGRSMELNWKRGSLPAAAVAADSKPISSAELMLTEPFFRRLVTERIVKMPLPEDQRRADAEQDRRATAFMTDRTQKAGAAEAVQPAGSLAAPGEVGAGFSKERALTIAMPVRHRRIWAGTAPHTPSTATWTPINTC